MRTAPSGIASAAPVASASALNATACAACCGRNCRTWPPGPWPVRTNWNISRRYSSPRRNSRPAAEVSKYDSIVAQTPSAAAHTSMRHTASPTRPRRSETTMKGYAGSTLRNGTSTGIPSATPSRYERAVPPTIAAGTRAGFMGKDYTARMRKVRGLLLAIGAIWCSGCIDASLLLQVSPDGSGHATITTRLYESGLKSFDSLFPDSPKEPIDIEAELPAPMPDQLRFIFGGDVKIASTKLAKAPDGGVRTTVVDFDDVTKIALPFPPIVGLSSGLRIGALSPADADSFIRFAMRPHENGDRLLV